MKSTLRLLKTMTNKSYHLLSYCAAFGLTPNITKPTLHPPASHTTHACVGIIQPDAIFYNVFSIIFKSVPECHCGKVRVAERLVREDLPGVLTLADQNGVVGGAGV